MDSIRIPCPAVDSTVNNRLDSIVNLLAGVVVAVSTARSGVDSVGAVSVRAIVAASTAIRRVVVIEFRNFRVGHEGTHFNNTTF